MFYIKSQLQLLMGGLAEGKAFVQDGAGRRGRDFS